MCASPVEGKKKEGSVALWAGERGGKETKSFYTRARSGNDSCSSSSRDVVAPEKKTPIVSLSSFGVEELMPIRVHYIFLLKRNKKEAFSRTSHAGGGKK